MLRDTAILNRASRPSPWIIFLIVLGSGLIAVGSVGQAWWKPFSSKSTPGDDAVQKTCCQSFAGAVPLLVFNPPGLQAAIEEAVANKDRGRSIVSLKVANQGQKLLSYVELLLLDLTVTEHLAGVEGRRLQTQIQPGDRQSLSFNTDLSHGAQNSRVVVVRSLGEGTDAREIAADELIRSIIEFRKTGKAPSVQISNRQQGAIRMNPNFCYEVFRLSNTLTIDAANAPVLSSSCTQSQRRFSLSFNRPKSNQ